MFSFFSIEPRDWLERKWDVKPACFCHFVPVICFYCVTFSVFSTSREFG